MNADPLKTFLAAAPAERLAMARSPEHAPAIEAYLGAAAFAEYRRVAERLDVRHLGIHAPKNLIFLPGVMGSLLMSRTKAGVWWIDLRHLSKIDRLRLAPDGRGDADPADGVAPFNLDPVYEPFLEAVLGEDRLGHELYPYDWRRPLDAGAGGLVELIERLHRDNGGQEVHLVAHSMGGLVVRAALAAHGNDALWRKIGRIVFVGTPHFGSPAIAGYLKNHLWGFELLALLGGYLSRETFRSLWGVLSLLPAPLGIYPGTRPEDPNPWRPVDGDDRYPHPSADFDLYDATAWKLDLDAGATARLQRVLAAAAAFHRRLWEAHRRLTPAQREKMRVLAGVGYQTLFRLERREGWLGRFKEMRKVTERDPGDRHREGDGRVPAASAELDGVEVRYVRGVHGSLTNIPAVSLDVLRCLKGWPMRLPATRHEALGAHLAAGEEDSAAPHLDGGARAGRFGDDPGLWNLDEPDPQRLDELRRAAEAGALPELTRVKLL